MFAGYPRYRGRAPGAALSAACRWRCARLAAGGSAAIPRGDARSARARRAREFLSTGALLGRVLLELDRVLLQRHAPSWSARASTDGEAEAEEAVWAALGGRAASRPDRASEGRAPVASCPYNVLEYADRMSMASGLELRAPFVDHRLVEYGPRPRRSSSSTMPRRSGRCAGPSPRAAAASDAPGRQARLNPPLGSWLQNEAAPFVASCSRPRRSGRAACSIRRRGRSA